MNERELKQLFVLANRFKQGDLLVGGTSDEQTSRDAREVVASLSIAEINSVALIEDVVTAALDRSLDRNRASAISNLTVRQLRDILLDERGPNWVAQYRDGLSSEVIGAVVKVMSDLELSRTARSLFNPLPGNGITIGSPQHFGSRIQPNSPGDDEEEILFSILEGLSYGCGDVILGLNPASDDVDTIVRLEELLASVVDRLRLPTRSCVLSDIVKQTSARARTRVDVGFQSLAGSSAALNGMVGLDVDGIAELARGFDGLYFETGQGSEVTNGVAEGVDMVTLESRTYGVARTIGRAVSDDSGRSPWMIVNDVSGFIGPEVFRSTEQLYRACLEDTVMAKLHGLTMGLDVCATFHMSIDPPSLNRLTENIVEHAAPAYLMAVAGNADPMLGYMTTSSREHPTLRRHSGKRIATAMDQRLTQLGIMTESGDLSADRDVGRLYAIYMQARGETRSFESFRAEANRKLAALQSKGFDIGVDDSPKSAELSSRRIEAIHEHARRSLYATLDRAVITDVARRPVEIRTAARDRDDYLSNPKEGERIIEADFPRLLSLPAGGQPRIQLILSDGLNANAMNENARELVPGLHQMLAGQGCDTTQNDLVIHNARLRAGYHVGGLLGADVVVHIIGERPGTGLNTLSAYLTYGRDKIGRSRWARDLDHSCTTAICGINRRGKHPAVAALEIAGVVRKILDRKCSGVELG
jgi:ethanolamine ammonia-lyase large subunit